MTTLLFIPMALLALVIALSAAQLRRLQGQAAQQIELTLRMGGETHRALTTLSGLAARTAGEFAEAGARVRAEADRLLEVASLRTGTSGPSSVDDEAIPPEEGERLFVRCATLLGDFALEVDRWRAVHPGESPEPANRTAICQQLALELHQVLDALPPAQRSHGSVRVFVWLANALLTASLEGSPALLPPSAGGRPTAA